MDLEHQPETPKTGRGGNGQPATKAVNAPACPADTQIFAFYENRLQFWERKKIEHHLVNCDRCRESLALLARLHGEAPYESGTLLDGVQVPGTEGEADRAQVARVLAYIERDEARQHTGRTPPRRVWLPIPARAFAAMAALLVLAFGAVFVYRLLLSESPADSGLKAVAMAVKNERRTNVMPSGLPYSPYASSLRGPGEVNLSFENAENKLRFARDKSAPPAARLALAKLYIARSQGSDTDNALSILKELAAAGIQSPDVLNDTGAALCGKGDYTEAIDYFNRALAANPRMNEALFNKAVAERQAGNREAAREDYQKFIDSASDQRWIQEARDRLKSIS